MDLDIRHDHDGAAVYARGALDLATSARLYAALSELREGGARRIHLDMSGVDSVDSGGLAALARWRDEARQRREEFRVHGGRGLVRRVLGP